VISMTDGFEPPTADGQQSFYLINRCTTNVRLHTVSRYANRISNGISDVISYDNLLLLPILSLKIILLLIVIITIIIIIIIIKITIIQIKALAVAILKYSFGIITCSVDLLSMGKFNIFCIYTQFLSQGAIHSGIRCWIREI
jgi:hypothetical protein